MACLGVAVADTDGDGMDEPKNLIDFGDADRSEWLAINDGVMGGISQSGIRRTDEGTGVFAGALSLENSGGFASVRAALGPHDLSTWAGLEVRVRGDGRTYQLRLRSDDGFDGIAYAADFQTRAGEWTVTRIPFHQFYPKFRGRALADVPPLDTSRIHHLAFMLADRKPGPFSLEIDFVRTWQYNTIGP